MRVSEISPPASEGQFRGRHWELGAVSPGRQHVSTGTRHGAGVGSSGRLPSALKGLMLLLLMVERLNEIM